MGKEVSGEEEKNMLSEKGIRGWGTKMVVSKFLTQGKGGISGGGKKKVVYSEGKGGKWGIVRGREKGGKSITDTGERRFLSRDIEKDEV